MSVLDNMTEDERKNFLAKVKEFDNIILKFANEYGYLGIFYHAVMFVLSALVGIFSFKLNKFATFKDVEELVSENSKSTVRTFKYGYIASRVIHVLIVVGIISCFI